MTRPPALNVLAIIQWLVVLGLVAMIAAGLVPAIWAWVVLVPVSGLVIAVTHE
ncbi:MAG: hypothetical protein QM708_13560 [Propioniciclava sp.]|uniref:hypothetical protein n=1 Tax=Propioniciclava sp. TaxID=2038686 RepID=UPI0039E48D61